jgi:hypothetical protein
MTLSFGTKGPKLTWTKKSSRFNSCIGSQMFGTKPGKQVRQAFTAAVAKCRGK